MRHTGRRYTGRRHTGRQKSRESRFRERRGKQRNFKVPERQEQRMKQIFLNLKRFDVPVEEGGINRLAKTGDWGGAVVSGIQDGISRYKRRRNLQLFFRKRIC